jgi:hypothetical protein
MSAADPATAKSTPPATKPKPRRSPVERVIVWGGIAALLVVLGIEGHARMAYGASLASLQKKLNESETGEDLKIANAHTSVRGVFRRTESSNKQSKRVVYSWFSLFKQYVIQLNASKDDVVLGLETPDAAPEEAGSELQQTVMKETKTPTPTGGGPRPAGEQKDTKDAKTQSKQEPEVK